MPVEGATDEDVEAQQEIVAVPECHKIVKIKDGIYCRRGSSFEYRMERGRRGAEFPL